MARRSLVIVLIAICAACKPAAKKPASPDARPQVRATVVTIRTTIQPENKTFTHALVIGKDRARFLGERDAWRLFDTNAKRVTFVNDATKTTRTESLDAILGSRRKTLANTLPAHYPRATVKRGERRPILEVNAEQLLIEAGAWRRELWFAEHRAIPDALFMMMHASDPPSSPLAPMMSAAEDALLRAKGFPLLDRSEIAYGKTTRVVERTVLSIVQRNVPASVLEVPKGYRDTTPPT
ncbi:MAG TPA: hypothetical protein VNA69_14225 [Thermoanaerobaculia bacterium]|nr:hypothetical protein [Thermoanaerobaculia bacterium]